MADVVSEIPEARLEVDIDSDPVAIVERVYQLWWHWANFELYVVSPSIPPVAPPIIIEPEIVSGTNEREFVYNIHDHGFKLTTSKSEDMYTGGMSMCKLFNTIEKMIYLLIERLKSGGIDEETEVQVAFGGHIIAQRKAFESVINLAHNVVVTNFDPGEWGENYLRIVKRLADKGYGYPPPAPRETRLVAVAPSFSR
ncbi:hypothetical protein [Legionella micdadei]|uniref:Virulence protein n=1 Tax=Legionella micdadei TaxID=451 RepID=A0A098GAY3_LEGMI|nr:hypothetical protein [Legionella micdadei]ARG96430.1 virulence factor [Legionella micdadei]ARG99179.1 virulence factor [Legionella micdadei]KTD29479.1 virulence protein [Legionella micdadei]NSL18123.1 virulence factor [Legionella micdadei]CEG59638.1 Virulence protein [Legionella micdadei]